MTGKRVYKIIVAGDGGIGKTTLLKIFCYNENFAKQNITIGNEIFLKKGKTKEGQEFFLQIWDLSGQDRFRFLIDSFVKGAVGAILGFDVKRRQSFINLKKWLELLREYDPDMPIVLMGTKKDIGYHPTLKPDMALKFIEEYRLKTFVEVSSKERENISKPFKVLIEDIVPGANEEVQFMDVSIAS